MIASKVNISERNEALVSLIENYAQVIPMDACILIPPNRQKENSSIPEIDFKLYKKLWLDPIFLTFPYLAIHEAVLKECFTPADLYSFLTGEIAKNRLVLLSDNNLTTTEKTYRDSIEIKIAKYTSYNPVQDNSDDRGEVKTLAHIKTKNYLYFCSRDSNAIRLVQNSEKYETSLDNIHVLHIYEIAYYLVRMNMCTSNQMKTIYKYIYHLTPKEKSNNLSWGEFLTAMDTLYLPDIQKSENKPNPLIVKESSSR
ncbi:hypothetical protein ACFVR2_17645 [Gottfriedia sp. NPDC057991]|uniref:hypothetical protein n=1 Tax=Gottfriedia sp. NPDC057991 TaxID=3346298 RepID=UPI0036DF9F49